jgi:hypothetical protein
MITTPPEVRILPLNLYEFRDLHCENGKDIQQKYFRAYLHKNGCFWYKKRGLKAVPGTVVLFQFEGTIIASATFIEAKRFDEPKEDDYEGCLYFVVKSIRIYDDPVNQKAMKKIWPNFRFSRVRQKLNVGAGRYLAFLEAFGLNHPSGDGIEDVYASPPKFPETSYRDEFVGQRAIYEHSELVKSMVTHGLIVRALRHCLKARRVGEIGNDKYRDLFIAEKRKRILALFEVKTDTSTSNIYEGIGQLMFHSAGIKPTPKRIMVMPLGLNTEKKRLLEDLGIQVLEYELLNGKTVFVNLEGVI